MSDPTRLVDGDAGLERSLVAAWGARQPSDAARLRTLAAVGVGSLAVATGAMAGTTGPTVASGVATASSSLLKWIAIAGGVAATFGGVHYVRLREPTPAPAAIPASPAGREGADRPALRDTAGPERTGTPAESSPTSVPSAEARAQAEPPLQARAQTSAPAAPSPTANPASAVTTASSLDEEVLALDQARRALASGDAKGAVQLAGAYDARFPNGALSQEATEIRIEALFRAGDRAQANRLATRFLAAHPTSPYARVIRALQSGAGTPSP